MERLSDIHVPTPRYTYPVVAGLGVVFPDRLRNEGPLQVVNRLGDLAPVMVALNEAADIGVPLDKMLQQGPKQNQFVPLLQVRNRLDNELKERRSRFVNGSPEHAETIDIIIKDFMLLARSRDKGNFPPTILELDSGIIEAVYTEVAFPGIIREAGVDFRRECETFEELKEKYSLYCISDREDKGNMNPIARKLTKLHALAMVMKLDDDLEDAKGPSFDRLMRLPNFALWADEESKRTGRNTREILKEVREIYMQHISGSFITRKIAEGISLGSHLSGMIKDGKARSRSEITSDDLNQLSAIIERSFTPGSTTLRHEMIELLYNALA